ncbi:MAG: hypothetical protein ACHRHE_22565, partial [Tepidisphaerales bacterium]
MMRWIPVAAMVLWAVVAGAADYAVVVSKKTGDDAAWKKVVDALVAKHKGEVIVYDGKVAEALPGLRPSMPKYACFVATPAEAGRAFVADVNRITRKLDDDPYTDCIWGILTGYDADNALWIAQQDKPLVVRKVGSGTELAMSAVEEGVWYCELQKNRMVKKEKGGEAAQLKGPDDTTAALVGVLNDYKPDMFVTSGHATEHDWMIGFRYQNGFFKCKNGQLYGEDTKRAKFDVKSPNPKVYLPIGNCLMGHVDGPEAMALAWMKSAGVCQMAGYTVPTWYGYAGWGWLDYFVEEPGRYTLAEAYYANQQALIHRLGTYFPEIANQEPSPGQTVGAGVKLSDAAKAAGLTAQDAAGLLHDRDVTAFYGDPAWEARMAPGPLAWEQELTEKDGVWTLT